MGITFRRTTAHDGRESIGPHVEGFALLFGVVVLDINAESDAALGDLAMVHNGANVKRRNAHLRKVRANRAPQIMRGPILNRKAVDLVQQSLRHSFR